MGITISFGGMPKMKARSITPSRPKTFANGSKNALICKSRGVSAIVMFARSHIISPAGAAEHMARERAKSVLSLVERTKICHILGIL